MNYKNFAILPTSVSVRCFLISIEQKRIANVAFYLLIVRFVYKTCVSLTNRAFEITNLHLVYNCCSSLFKCDISFYNSAINFLKQFEKTTLPKTTKIHVIINCGFLEPEQNNVAIDMLRYFCGKNEFTYGMTLCIAAGEAIMSTPFAFMVRRKIKKFVSGINCGKKDILAVSMPLTKKMFLKASAQYWKKYGEKFNTSEEEMRSDKIEDM